jgi:hypothetical protein
MTYKDFFKEDLIPGGKGDTSSPQSFDPHELAMGMKVEMEHTRDQRLAKEIAIDHLTEDPHYYSKLNQSGLADELGNVPSERSVVEPDTKSIRPETVPGTVFPEVPNDPLKNGPDMVGCIGSTREMGVDDKSDVDSPSKDPTQTDHITGAMGSTPTNPAILPKTPDVVSMSKMVAPVVNSIIPQDISIDIAEGKKILKKMMKESTKGPSRAFSSLKEMVPVAGDPSEDPAYVKGKRWTVQWNNENSEMPVGWNKGFQYPLQIGAGGKETPFQKNGQWFIRVWDAKDKKHYIYNYTTDMLEPDEPTV